MTLILSGTNGLSDVDGDASTPAVRGTDANSGIFFGADTVGVSTNGVERVEFGNSETVFNDGGASVDFRVEGDTDANLLFVDASADAVGIGVAPSAWNSDYKALDVSPYGNFHGRISTQSTGITLNCYRNSAGNWIYKNTAQAARYDQDSGFHIWYNAPSGTAGNAITFTQAMTLDSSGNLLVGTTSAGTMSGNVVQRLGNTGIIPRTSTSLANNGTLDITVSSGGASFTGFLIVETVLLSNANVRTQTTYSVFGRGTTLTATSIATVNGPSGGRTFTITCPSTGLIRFTNTSGDTVGVNMTFFGSEGF